MSPRLARLLHPEEEGTFLSRLTGRLWSGDHANSSPEFKIEPSDAIGLAEDEPRVAPALFTFRVEAPDEDVTFLVRQVRYLNGNREFWIKRQGFAPSLRLCGLSPDASAGQVVEFYHKGTWSRCIVLDAHFEMATDAGAVARRVIVRKGSLTYWEGPDDHLYQFKLAGVPERYRWGEYYSTPDLVRLLNKQLKDPRSDCAFGLRWASLTPEERTAWIYKTKRGTLAQCEQMLNWFLSSGDWWDNDEEMVCVMDYLPSKSKPHKLYPNPISNLGVRPRHDEQGWVSLSSKQRQILSLIDQHFGVYYDEQCRHHQQLGLKRPHCWQLSLKSPTFHERLEARLQLRDWLSDKLLPSEVAALMS